MQWTAYFYMFATGGQQKNHKTFHLIKMRDKRQSEHLRIQGNLVGWVFWGGREVNLGAVTKCRVLFKIIS